MTRRHKIVISVACILIALVALCFFWPRENEPSYNGRTLTEWLEQYAPTDDSVPPPARRKEAADAVLAMGTNCIPALLRWNVMQEADWRLKAARVIEKVSSRHSQQIINRYLLRGSAEWHHDLAESGFAILTTNAVVALPELERQFNAVQNPDQPFRTANIIAFLGRAGVDFLLETAAHNSTPSQRYNALEALQRCQLPESSVPTLLAIVKSGDENSMALAAVLLQQFRSHGPEIARALADALNSSNTPKRKYAAEILRLFATDAKPAVPALVKLLNDPDLETRQAARTTLQYIAPEVLTNTAQAAKTN